MLCLWRGILVEHRPWSDDELDKARRWRRKGAGATEIGRRLGRTRNSVIGALNRAKEPRVLANQHGEGGGKWSLKDQPARPIPLRFSEQNHV